MCEKVSGATDEPASFPKNVEFLGFIGGWDSYDGVEVSQRLFYLIRTGERDWLEEVIKCSGQVISRKCAASMPRKGTKQAAAAQLLQAHIRSRVHFEWPTPPYRTGGLNRRELKSIVETISDELKRNTLAAETAERLQETPIIKLAKELGLNPRPAGHNDHAWIATCPGTSHWLMISGGVNQFGCGWCKRKGGPDELRSFYDERNRPRRQ